MTQLSYDPYEGASRAFFVLYPNLTGEDWERFLRRRDDDANGELDNFKALGWLCRQASCSGVAMDPDAREKVAYAVGFFEAMHMVISSLVDALPISGLVPPHLPRHRRSLMNAASQFE